MWQQRRSPVLLTATLLSGMTLGFCFPEVLAAMGHRQVAQGGLPESYVGVRGESRGQGGLRPHSSYYRVLGYLKDRYYGYLPGDAPLTYAALRGLLRPLDDPFTRFLEPAQYRALREQNEGGYVGLGALLAPTPTADGYRRVGRVLRGTLAQKAGLRPQDVIVKVDGVSTRGKDTESVERMLRGRADTPVRLTIRRGASKLIPIAIHRQAVTFEVVESRMLEGRVGLLSLSEFNEQSDAQIDRALTRLERQGVKALVLDLRGNRGGTLDAAQEIASRFLPRGKTVVTVVEREGEAEVRRVLAEKHNHRFNQPGRMLPLAVLVNRTSASAAEIVSGAIQDHRTGILLGTPTYGKGLVQTVVPLRGGAAIAITSARYLTPSGRDINRDANHRGGITPDVVVEATEEDWLRRNDVQLQRALALLHRRIGYQRSPRGPRPA